MAFVDNASKEQIWPWWGWWVPVQARSEGPACLWLMCMWPSSCLDLPGSGLPIIAIRHKTEARLSGIVNGVMLPSPHARGSAWCFGGAVTAWATSCCQCAPPSTQLSASPWCVPGAPFPYVGLIFCPRRRDWGWHWINKVSFSLKSEWELSSILLLSRSHFLKM